MLRTAVEFMRKLNQLSTGLRLWLLALIAVNLFIPLGFLAAIEARVTMATFLLAFALGAALFKRFGFSRIVALMHVPWYPLIVYLWWRLPETAAAGAFGLWLRSVIILNAIALIFDTKDVVKYLAGDREPVR